MPSSSGIRSTWPPSSSNSSRKAIPCTRVTSRTCGPRAMPISMSMGNIALTWRRDGDVRDYSRSVSLDQQPLSAKNFSITTGKRIGRRTRTYLNGETQVLDLHDTDLQGAALWEAQLQGANLEGAQLQGAILWGAQLQEAFLRGAQLQEAHLE